ncbi:MAG: hypothetical protein SPJ13_00855 [Bacteroidales bacterium]|nr:hypothetical protein [Bacteroidales bacterium]
MKKLYFFMLACLAMPICFAQKTTGEGLSMTFTSQTEAKFFIYLNGQLQNKKSTGSITLCNLEDKRYHVRIVMDDPFEIAATATIRPNKDKTQYAVLFNPVRERIYVKQGKDKWEEGGWYGEPFADTERNKENELRQLKAKDEEKAAKKRERRQSRKEQVEQAENHGTTGKDVKQNKTPIIVED